jgi:hypothetical protein
MDLFKKEFPPESVKFLNSNPIRLQSIDYAAVLMRKFSETAGGCAAKWKVYDQCKGKIFEE